MMNSSHKVGKNEALGERKFCPNVNAHPDLDSGLRPCINGPSDDFFEEAAAIRILRATSGFRVFG